MASVESTISVPYFYEKVHKYLQDNPNECDVTFCVGSEKEIVKAVRLILVASSVEFNQLFEDKWDEAVVKDGDGIPLPDVDPEAFKLLLKLLPSDTKCLLFTKELGLTTNQLFSLLDVCNTFGLKDLKCNLEILIKDHLNLKHFLEYVESQQFLEISPKALKQLLTSDQVPLEEIKIFNNVCKWAEHRCAKLGQEVDKQNVRNAIGDCLFEVRFPLMTIKDLSGVVRPRNILTDQERLEILDYVTLDKLNNVHFNSPGTFKVSPRIRTVKADDVDAKPATETKDCALPLRSDWSVAKLFNNPSLTSASTPHEYFTCDGNWVENNCFNVDQRISLVGISFRGPVDSDATYDVNVIASRYVEIVTDTLYGRKSGSWVNCTLLEQKIHAKRLQTFQVFLDQPLVVEPQTANSEHNFRIDFSLKGPRTRCVSTVSSRSGSNKKTKKLENVTFMYSWKSGQLSELLFRKL